MRIQKKILKVFFACVALVTVERFCRAQTAGFRVDKLHSDFEYQSTIRSSIDPRLIAQSFTFLGSGVQSYAFLGEDGETVLKVFKHYHNFPIKGAIKSLPLPHKLGEYRDKLVERREQRLHFIFSSCELAYLEFKEETGILALHLEPTTHLKQPVVLIDKLGISHEIDADSTAFILQKKAEMLSDRVSSLKNDPEALQETLRCLVHHIVKRCKQGIMNHDLRIERNVGFIGSRAIEVDVGSFSKIEKSQNELKKELKTFRKWVSRSHPELLYVVDKEIETHL
jgi:hypothetical protein